MKVSSISINDNTNQRKNMFIRYSNSFMSAINGNNQAFEKTQNLKQDGDSNVEKPMGIETLTIFPKKIVDGRTIITA